MSTKKILSIGIIGVLLFCSTKTFAVRSLPDSLLILENDNGKQVVVGSNKKVKIWLHDNTQINGIFQDATGQTLTILSDSQEENISIEAIKTIHFYTSKKKILLGLALILLGIIGLLIGLLTAFTLIIGLSGGRDAIIPSILLPPASIGVIIQGIRLKGRRFNLKKWRIQNQ